MFFLGGINSILPYILYLSLIWVFLIIGYGSRYVQGLNELTPKTKYTDNQALQHFDNQIFQYYQSTHHVVEPKDVKVAFPLDVKYILPLVLQNHSPGSSMLPLVNSCPVSSTGFRGPPIHKV